MIEKRKPFRDLLKCSGQDTQQRYPMMLSQLSPGVPHDGEYTARPPPFPLGLGLPPLAGFYRNCSSLKVEIRNCALKQIYVNFLRPDLVACINISSREVMFIVKPSR